MNPFPDFQDNIPYILNLFLDEHLTESEKNNIMKTIYDSIHEKEIEKNLYGCTKFVMKWNVFNETNLLQYYGYDRSKLLSNEGLHEHTKMILNDVREIVGKNKFSFIITKPLTKKVCMI